MTRKYRDPSDGSLIENNNPTPRKKPQTVKKSTRGKWIVQDIKVKGYCRQCWKKFDITLQQVPIDGWTMQDFQKATGIQLKCCPDPDIRFIPV